jgi:hypothetical protein
MSASIAWKHALHRPCRADECEITGVTPGLPQDLRVQGLRAQKQCDQTAVHHRLQSADQYRWKLRS